MTWKEISLGEVINIKHGYAFKSKFFSNSGKYIVLTPGNCYETGGLKLKGEKEKYYIGDPPEEFILSKNDLLIVMTDLVQSAPILGGSFLIPDNDKFLHNQRLGLVKIQNPDVIDKRYLFYVLNTNNYRSQVRGSATGTTVKHTAPERLYRCKIPFPPLQQQNKIADILSKYDDLIENNRRRIELLEESARLLYREWFVHLRFPGHEHSPIIDGIPEGWKYEQLGNLVLEIIDYRGKTPKKLGGNWSNSGIPAISALNVKNNQLINLDKCKFVDEDLYEKWMKSKLQKGDILMTSEAPLGEISYFSSDQKYCLSQRLYAIRANPKLIKPSILCYSLLSSRVQAEIYARQTGTTVFGIRQTALRQVPILVPPMNLQENISPTLEKFLDQKHILKKQIYQLQKARDLLLPRLMNGEITV